MKNNKNKIQYVCQACGNISPKWLGRCSDCGAWNTMVEEIQKAPGKRAAFQAGKNPGMPIKLNDIKGEKSARFKTGISELDNVLGGGPVKGALILVGGDPGIGKSTLLLQMAIKLASTGKRVFYITGEESAVQIKMRTDRLGEAPDTLWLYCETDVEQITSVALNEKPDVMIIDSIQTLTHPEIGSVPGSVSQIRESGGVLMNLAKSEQITIFLVGHVTKDGQLAGPRILEHMVDTVLYFEGDKEHGYRLLRTMKNRFGSTNETGMFEMTQTGLEEIKDPSALFLSERVSGASGTAVAVSMEGSRPLLVEVQSLVATAYFGMPQRRVSGLDYNRVCLMLAVLEKRGSLSLGSQDVFVSIAGGLSVTEPAMDLAIAAAVASSLKDKAIMEETAMFGEIGLGGEIRAVTQPEKRLQEVIQMGFKRCILPDKNRKQLKEKYPLEIIGVKSISEAMGIWFKNE